MGGLRQNYAVSLSGTINEREVTLPAVKLRQAGSAIKGSKKICE
jgi:hypothetical protein